VVFQRRFSRRTPSPPSLTRGSSAGSSRRGRIDRRRGGDPELLPQHRLGARRSGAR
jgi:hypothetical protein